MATPSLKKRVILALARSQGVIRPRDAEQNGIARRLVYELVAEGQLIQSGRGLYRLPHGQFTANHSLAEVAKQVPNGVVCLLSALRFYELTTELPAEVWIALPPKAWAPKVKQPVLRVVRFSGEALSRGVEVRTVEGVSIRIFDIAKTIADCFKFRNKIGTAVAVEALREAWRKHRIKADDLWRYAKICRVTNVIRPYLETL